MQFVNGITLQEYLHRSREQQQKHHYGQMRYNKSLRERLEMFLHICDAIEYSHNRHIIHCDLKPANIMIGRYGEVYVMDWGAPAKRAPTGKDMRTEPPPTWPRKACGKARRRSRPMCSPWA